MNATERFVGLPRLFYFLYYYIHIDFTSLHQIVINGIDRHE